MTWKVAEFFFKSGSVQVIELFEILLNIFTFLNFILHTIYLLILRLNLIKIYSAANNIVLSIGWNAARNVRCYWVLRCIGKIIFYYFLLNDSVG